MISVPNNPELGPNNKSKSPEIRPGQVPLRDVGKIGGAAINATRRSQLGNAAGSSAIKGAMKDQKKGK